MILPRGTLGDPWDIYGCHMEGGVFLDQGCCSTPHRVQDGPTPGNDQAEVSAVPLGGGTRLCSVRSIIYPTVKELRPREGEWLAPGHTATIQWPSWVQSPSACQQSLLLNLGS